jgi:hypothetical protein
MRSNLQRLAFFLIVALLATGCAAKKRTIPPPPQFAWLEAPLDHSTLSLQPVEVKSYGYSPAGLAVSELSINGVVLRTDPLVQDPDPRNYVYHVSQTWQPPGPGTYTLSVRFQTKSGVWVTNVKSATVTVGGASAPTLPPTSLPATTTVPTGTATVATTGTSLPTATRAAPTATVTPSRPASTGTRAATLLPSATATLAATFTATTAAPFTTFTADSLSINAGQCTTLHWTSGNITAIFLNNQGVTGSENRQVCPTVTTVYELKAATSGADLVKTLTITVTGATATASATLPATATNSATTAAANTATNTATSTNTAAASPPSFGGYSTSTNIFDNFPDCATHGTSVTITVTVSNAAGVIIHYHVAGDPNTYGGPMTNTTGNTWSRTITAGSDIPDSIVGELQFSFTANGSGSVDNGPYGGVTLNDCAS